jgi:predicted MFS family arabinose efflux permease
VTDRWRWVLLPFCALALTMGVRSAFGVYVLPWEAEYGSGRAQIASVSSLSLLVYGLGNVLAGPAAERFGVDRVMTASLALVACGLVASALARGLGWLYLFYGLVASAGFSGASHVTASVAVRQRFPEGRRSFALSVVVAGMSAGQMFVVPAQVLAVAQWGWRPVLSALGATAALLATAVAVGFRPGQGRAPQGPAREGAGGRARTGALVRDPWFWVFVAPYAVCGFTDSGLVDNHFVPYARGVGVSEAVLAASLSALAVANLAGTVVAGYLADRWGRAPVLAGLYALRAAALAVLVLGGARVVWAFAPLFGATHFATIAPTNTLALTLFQASAPGLAVGLASLVHQLGAAAGAFAGGAAFDRFGSYRPAFALGAALLLASAGTLGWIHRAQVRPAAQLRWAPRRA